jgi:hypothetical protein
LETLIYLLGTNLSSNTARVCMPAITLSWRCCFQHLFARQICHQPPFFFHTRRPFRRADHPLTSLVLAKRERDRPPRPPRRRGRRNRPTENETTPPSNPLVGRLLAQFGRPFLFWWAVLFGAFQIAHSGRRVTAASICFTGCNTLAVEQALKPY